MQFIEAVLYDEHRVLSVSSPLTHSTYDGITDVRLSVPAVVDRTGVRGGARAARTAVRRRA